MKRLSVLLALGLVACIGGPTLVLDATSPRSAAETRRCVTDALQAEGFALVDEGSEERSVLVAEGVYQRPDTVRVLGFQHVETLTEWGRMEVDFAESGGETDIRYTAATRTATSGPWGDPSITMAEWAEEISAACS